jgi:hypothetical protein
MFWRLAASMLNLVSDTMARSLSDDYKFTKIYQSQKEK